MNAIKRKDFQILRIYFLMSLFMRNFYHVNSGCRQQLQNEVVKPIECESICRYFKNSTKPHCELRILVILPNQAWQYEAALPRV